MALNKTATINTSKEYYREQVRDKAQAQLYGTADCFASWDKLEEILYVIDALECFDYTHEQEQCLLEKLTLQTC